jgi:cysteine desulfurase/selenocysteine lyase
VREHEKNLVRYALRAFENIPDFTLYGKLGPERRGATFSFNIGDSRGGIIHAHDAGTYLDTLGIAIRAGHHCAKPLMTHYGVAAMCRASCYLYSTEEEIDCLAEGIEKVRKFFKGV